MSFGQSSSSISNLLWEFPTQFCSWPSSPATHCLWAIHPQLIVSGADDFQIYLFTPEQFPVQTKISACLSDHQLPNAQLSASGQLAKTEFLISTYTLSFLSHCSNVIFLLVIESHDLGIIFNMDPTLDPHIQSISKSFYSCCAIFLRKQPFLSIHTAETLFQPPLTSYFNYCVTSSSLV